MADDAAERARQEEARQQALRAAEEARQAAIKEGDRAEAERIAQFQAMEARVREDEKKNQ